MIWDCFLYNGEFDHLKIRLEELWDVVDQFVVVESSVTFQGQKRELAYPDQDAWVQENYGPGKVIYVKVQDVPELGGRGGAGTPEFMLRERYVRDAMRRGYGPLARDNDVILISDVDEIPRVSAVLEAQRRLMGTERSLVFQMGMYVWNRGWFWPGPSWNTCAYLAGSGIEPQEARDLRGQMVERGHIVGNAGWHLTWMGGPEANRRKLASFSHAEHLDKANKMEELAIVGYDINGVKLWPTEDDEEWPRYFEEHPNLWP